jgi:hypothetical protein
MGLDIELHKPNSGSHWLLRSAAVSYPLPLHNGLKSEVSDVYLKGLCRAFGIDFQVFRQYL